MSIYHASLKTFSRSKGQSAIAAAAYRAGVTLWDERQGRQADYARRHGVAETKIFLPDLAPSWMQDRGMLWNMAEWSEKRCNSTVAREWELALPARLPAAGRQSLVARFCRELVARYGVAVDAAIHLPSKDGDERNHHAHIMFSTREVTASGFGKKTRVLDDRKTGKQEVERMRETWAAMVNAALAAAGLSERVDHRSHKDRAIDAPPTIHEGVTGRNAARAGDNLISFPQLKQGRVIDWPAIDQGHTRAEHNADVIDLQKYRQAETAAEKLARVVATIADTAASIEQLQAALNSGNLSDDMIGRIRFAIEHVRCVLARKAYIESDLIRQVYEAREKKKEIEELRVYMARMVQIERDLRDQMQQAAEKRAAAWELNTKIERMTESLIGIPPHIIKLEIPTTAKFNEASFAAAVHRQSTAALERAVRSPPTIARRPELATVALRQDVLQVKEILSRSRPRKQGSGRVETEKSFSFKSSRR